MLSMLRFLLIVSTVALSFRGIMVGGSRLAASVFTSGLLSRPAQHDAEARCAASPMLPAAVDVTPTGGARLAYQLGLRYGVNVALRNILERQDPDSSIAPLS